MRNYIKNDYLANVFYEILKFILWLTFGNSVFNIKYIGYYIAMMVILIIMFSLDVFIYFDTSITLETKILLIIPSNMILVILYLLTLYFLNIEIECDEEHEKMHKMSYYSRNGSTV